MRRAQDFSAAVRTGSRSGTKRLVVHLALAPGLDEARRDGPPLVGFIVPKAVGPAVRRNQVKRRLRALMAARLGRLADGERLVVRALPDAAGVASADLAEDLDSALAGARRKARAR